MSKKLTYRDPLSIERALTAVAVLPTLADAVAQLKDEGYTTTEVQLENWRKSKAERYEEIRSELAPLLERHLANDMRSNAHLTVECERLVLEGAMKQIKEGRVSANEMPRMARDFSQVKAQSIDKLMTLEERPTHITENRTIEELGRSLVGLGVAEFVDSTATEIEEEAK